MLISEILRKWFGLGEPVCLVCETLREQLHRSEAERSELLHRILAPPTPEPVPQVQEMKPIMPQHVPWRVRQQMLEAEDREQARILREKAKEIEQLEKEVGIADA